jgi:hypothetical protein
MYHRLKNIYTTSNKLNLNNLTGRGKAKKVFLSKLYLKA